MLIKDINYLEVITEDNKIEGSGSASLYAYLDADGRAQSDVYTSVYQDGYVYAFTGYKSTSYNSSMSIQGLT